MSKKIPKSEYSRDYRVERDPDPNLRVFPREYEIVNEEEWH
jgi:hypothetical protein